MIKQNTYINFLKTSIFYLSFAILFLTAVFTRSFLGLNIGPFLLGQLFIGFGLLVSFYVLIVRKPISYFEIKDSKFNKIYLIIIFYFLTRIILNYRDLSLYYFKSSSFIWTIGFLYLGLIVYKFSIDSLLVSFGFLSLPFVVYIFQTGNYPDLFIKIFLNYSDKFQFMKSSDMVIVLIVSCFYLKKYYFSDKFYIFWINILVVLYFPLVASNSRGAVVGLVSFYVLDFILNFKNIKKLKFNILIILIINIIVFSLSSLRLTGVDIQSPDTNISVVSGIPSAVSKIIEEKNTQDVFLSFYFADSRIFSSDPTTNWRLDIWQDVVQDLGEKNRILRGYGYNEIIPVMTDPSAPGRLGRDGLNEHVHNYLVTIFARGGLINLFLFLYLHFELIKKFMKSSFGIYTLCLVIPCFLMSSVDITMDGVQFPLIYYFFIGYFLQDKD
jgi:hypothetical protein